MLTTVCLFCRVEILENIFSLLFLRYEDFQEETSSDSGADDDDGDYSSRVPKSEIVSKCMDSTAYKNFGRTEVTHSMTSFQQVCDVSSSLRMMPVIEAHVSVSPPLEQTDVSPIEPLHWSSSPRADDTFLTDSTTCVQATDMSSVSKMPPESLVNISSQAADTRKCSSQITATFDKLPDSLSEVGTASLSASDRHSSVPNEYDTPNIITLQSVGSASLSSTVTSDFSKLPAYGDINQLSKSRQRKKSTKSNHSENASVRSGASSRTGKGTQQGFLCSQHLIRDVLNCLKECLVETSAAFYSSLTMDTVGMRKIEVSSIQPDLLQQRMNR
jgi:hypothetical protein